MTMNQKHRPGLGAQLDYVPGAIVFLLFARPLMTLDEVGLVLIDRERAGDTRLRESFTFEPVHVQRG